MPVASARTYPPLSIYFYSRYIKVAVFDNVVISDN